MADNAWRLLSTLPGASGLMALLVPFAAIPLVFDQNAVAGPCGFVRRTAAPLVAEPAFLLHLIKFLAAEHRFSVTFPVDETLGRMCRPKPRSHDVVIVEAYEIDTGRHENPPARVAKNDIVVSAEQMNPVEIGSIGKFGFSKLNSYLRIRSKT